MSIFVFTKVLSVANKTRRSSNHVIRVQTTFRVIAGHSKGQRALSIVPNIAHRQLSRNCLQYLCGLLAHRELSRNYWLGDQTKGKECVPITAHDLQNIGN